MIKEIVNIDNLCRALLALKTEEECKEFLYDICTIQELETLSQRLEVAERLINGDSYSDISRDLGASPATISRVNKYINYGDGGYKLVIGRIKND